MSECREFSTAVIASISSGVMLCDSFSDLHEAAEYLMGHPIFNRHFASKDLCKKMQKAVTDQHPGFPTKISGVTKENYLDKLAKIENKLGKTVKIKKGDGSSIMHPLDGIQEATEVILVGT